MEKTRLSNKGQVVIPKAVRVLHGWKAGLEFAIEDQQNVFQAISWCESGLDFADALHLASSMKADKFVTFDNALIKKARKLISIDITLS